MVYRSGKYVWSHKRQQWLICGPCFSATQVHNPQASCTDRRVQHEILTHRRTNPNHQRPSKPTCEYASLWSSKRNRLILVTRFDNESWNNIIYDLSFQTNFSIFCSLRKKIKRYVQVRTYIMIWERWKFQIDHKSSSSFLMKIINLFKNRICHGKNIRKDIK